MKKIIIFCIPLLVITIIMVGCSSQDKPEKADTITCELKGYGNKNNAVITFENGKSVKAEVEETLGSGYDDELRLTELAKAKNNFKEATLEGEILKYTIDGTDVSYYLGVNKEDFQAKWCK